MKAVCVSSWHARHPWRQAVRLRLNGRRTPPWLRMGHLIGWAGRMAMTRVFIAFDDMGSLGIRQNRQVFEQLAKTDEDVTIDMSNVTFLDGSGVGAIAYVKRRLNANGRAVNVINAKGQPSDVLADLGLSGWLRHTCHRHTANDRAIAARCRLASPPSPTSRFPSVDGHGSLRCRPAAAFPRCQPGTRAFRAVP